MFKDIQKKWVFQTTLNIFLLLLANFMVNSRAFEIHTINIGIIETNVNLYLTTGTTLLGINLSWQLNNIHPTHKLLPEKSADKAVH